MYTCNVLLRRSRTPRPPIYVMASPFISYLIRTFIDKQWLEKPEAYKKYGLVWGDGNPTQVNAGVWGAGRGAYMALLGSLVAVKLIVFFYICTVNYLMALIG